MIASTFKPGGGRRRSLSMPSTRRSPISTATAHTLARDRRRCPTGMQGTQPNLSADDSTLVFVVARRDRTRISHGRATTTSWAARSTRSASTRRRTRSRTLAPFLDGQPGTQNYYYPDSRSDGNFVVFNEKTTPRPRTTTATAFYNRKARVKLLHFPAQAGDAPLDLPALNVGRRAHRTRGRAGARSSRRYKDHKILWVTFSSNRDYGLHLVNTGFDNCYPPESPGVRSAAAADQAGRHVRGLRRSRRSGWRRSSSTPTARSTSTDRSFPAFWLPFQDVTAHNHSAQWVATVQGGARGGRRRGRR